MVSIVIPCYNGASVLSISVDSILKQTKEDFELVIVDDGSTDETGAICDEIATRDSRVRILHQKNGGLMNAWKNGVRIASGEYIAFCDADDYYDADFLEKVEEPIQKYHPQMLLYGISMEYEDGKKKLTQNRLDSGFYTREQVEKDIFPILLSDGTMESTLILPSRYSKVFQRELLLSIFDLLNEKVTNGEDKLTMMASVLRTESIYCMKDFFPYHYIRNDQSMIGKYDVMRFQKLVILQEAMLRVAEQVNYAYRSKVDETYISDLMICAKKEICRNPYGYKNSRKQLRMMRTHEYTENAIRNISTSRYGIASKIFYDLFKYKFFGLLYNITRCASKIGAGKA